MGTLPTGIPATARPTVKFKTLLRVICVLSLIQKRTSITLDPPTSDSQIITSFPVRHFDCSEKGVETTQVYSITKVPDCNLAPEDLKLATLRDVAIFQDVHRTKTPAIRCEIKYSSIAYKFNY